MYQTILFDLDGTLTNSELGITNSVAYALGKYGIQVPDKKALRVFIGPPLQESFERFYGFSKEECLKAIDYYHEYFSEKGLYENEVYLGVPDLLASLKQAGKQLIVATSKPEEFSIQILKHFGLYDYFDFVAGATMDRKRSKKKRCYPVCLGAKWDYRFGAYHHDWRQGARCAWRSSAKA